MILTAARVNASVAIFALLVAACQSTPVINDPSLAEVREKRLEWNGRTVNVRGTIEGCKGEAWGCVLFTGPSDDKRSVLIIDFVPDLEPQLAAVAGREISLRARVTDECARQICTDRGPDIVPLQILKVY